MPVVEEEVKACTGGGEDRQEEPALNLCFTMCELLNPGKIT